MSKDITIQEGGVNKTLNGIKKIQTPNSFDGYPFTQTLTNAGQYTRRTDTLFTVQEAPQLTAMYIAGKLVFTSTLGDVVITYNGEQIHSGSTRSSGYTDAFWAYNPTAKVVTLGYLYDGTRYDIGFSRTFPVSEGDTSIITVKWNRPVDNKVLSDTFEIKQSTGSEIDHDYHGEQE